MCIDKIFYFVNIAEIETLCNLLNITLSCNLFIKKAEKNAEGYDPKFFVQKIGEQFKARICDDFGDFIKITLIGDNDIELYSVIYPTKKTKCPYRGYNIASLHVISTASQKIIKQPLNSADRLRRVCGTRPSEVYVQLMPNPNLAAEVREHCRWLSLFDSDNHDGCSAAWISQASRIIIEAYDFYDFPTNHRFVYERSSRSVHMETLWNWPSTKPFDFLDWRPLDKRLEEL